MQIKHYKKYLTIVVLQTGPLAGGGGRGWLGGEVHPQHSWLNFLLYYFRLSVTLQLLQLY